MCSQYFLRSSFTAACYNIACKQAFGRPGLQYFDQKVVLVQKITILSHGGSTAQLVGENRG